MNDGTPVWYKVGLICTTIFMFSSFYYLFCYKKTQNDNQKDNIETVSKVNPAVKLATTSKSFRRTFWK